MDYRDLSAGKQPPKDLALVASRNSNFALGRGDRHMVAGMINDGWVARNFNQLQLAESEEMKQDRAYLEKRARDLTDEGFSCEAMLALGEPSDEIVKLAREKNVDLIAMTTHGHRLISDILYGATADKVRHAVDVPVLLLKVRT